MKNKKRSTILSSLDDTINTQPISGKEEQRQAQRMSRESILNSIGSMAQGGSGDRSPINAAYEQRQAAREQARWDAYVQQHAGTTRAQQIYAKQLEQRQLRDAYRQSQARRQSVIDRSRQLAAEQPEQMARWYRMDADAYERKASEAQGSTRYDRFGRDTGYLGEDAGEYAAQQSLAKEYQSRADAARAQSREVSAYGEQLRQQRQAEQRAQQIAEDPAAWMRWAQQQSRAAQQRWESRGTGGAYSGATDGIGGGGAQTAAESAAYDEYQAQLKEADDIYRQAYAALREQEAAGQVPVQASGAEPDARYRAVNGQAEQPQPRIIGSRSEGNAASAAITGQRAEAYMTDMQRQTYDYLYATQGQSAAEGYYRTIEPELEQARTQATQEEFAGLSEQAPAAMTLLSTLAQPTKIAAGLTSVGDALLGDEVDTDSAFYTPVQAASAIRQTAPQVTDWFGDKQIFGQDADSYIYGIITSSLDSAFNMALASGLGSIAGGAAGLTEDATTSLIADATSALMGAEMMPDTIIEEKAKGRSDAEATAIGIIRSLIEGVTEKYSIEYFLGDPTTFGKKLGKAFLAEGGEEVASNWLNNIVDIISADPENLLQQWRDRVDSGEQSALALAEVIEGAISEDVASFLAGGISGLGMGAVHEGISRAAQDRQASRLGSAGQADAQAVVDEALAVNPNSKAAQKAKERLDAGKSVGKVQLGRIMAESDTVIQPQEQALEKAAEKYGRQSGAMQATYDGEQDVQQYDEAYHVAYEMGRAGANLQTAQTSAATEYLSPDQRQAAWEAGRDSVGAESAADTASGHALLDGQFARVQSISEQGGKVYAEILQGTETKSVALDEIKMDAGTKMLAESAQQYGTAASTVFEQYQKGQQLTQYLRSAETAVSIGMASPSASSKVVLDNLKSGQLGKVMSAEQIEALYKAGQRAGKAQLRKTGMTRLGTGSFTLEDSAKGAKLDKRQRAAVRFLRDLSRVTGLDISVYKSAADADGRLTGANGSYVDGHIRIDLNAGAIYEGNLENAAMLRTVSHELTHFMAETAETEFKELQSFLVEKLSAWEGHSIQDLVEEKMAIAEQNGHPITEAEALEEVVADGCEMMLRDSKAVRQLAEENRTLFEKVRDWLTRFFDSLKKAFEGVDAMHKESIHMMENYAEELQKLWDEALTAAVKNAKESGQKNSARAGADAEIKHSDRVAEYAKPITPTDVEILRSIGRKSINEFTSEDIEKAQKWAYKFYQDLGTKSPFFRAWFGDWRARDTQEVQFVPVNADFVENRGEIPRGEFKNSDTGFLIKSTSDGIDETSSKRTKHSREYRALKDIQKMIENAILFDTVNVTNPSKRMGKNAVFVHHLYCPVSINGTLSIAKLYVTEDISDVKRFYLTKIEKASDAAGLSRNWTVPGGKNATTSDAKISVADLFRFVKEHNGDFESDSKTPTDFNPKSVDPRFLNDDGTPKQFYHGAKRNGGFTTFRDWQYFTEKESYAQRYAERGNPNAMYAVYLTADKVFDTRNSRAAAIFNEIRQEYGMGELQENGLPDWTDGYDITDYLSEHPELGYDAVVLDEGGDLVNGKPVSRGVSIVIRDSSQVKSATDNIGTFNRGNKDIRYSDRAPLTTEQAEAEKRFGTTTDFNEAGFILPNGKMLRFTDDANAGARNYDHRAIGMMYGVDVDLTKNHGFNMESNRHMNRFVEDGGIRFDPGDPDYDMGAGMQLSKSKPLTKAQERTIRDFIAWKQERDAAYVPPDEFAEYMGAQAPVPLTIEFGGGADIAVGARSRDLAAWNIPHLTYEGGQINADRVIADIRHYYETGELRKPSEVARFRYSERNDIVDVNGKEYDSVIMLDKPISLRELKDRKKFAKYLVRNLYDKKISVLDQNGDVEILEFAGQNETVTKNNNRHKVRGELEFVRGDTRRVIIANLEEIAEHSVYDPVFSNDESSHGWLDQNGWESRKANVTDGETVYEALLKIAKSRDGRNILYAVNCNVKDGIAVDMDATQKRAAVLAATPSEERIAQKTSAVKRQERDITITPAEILDEINLDAVKGTAAYDALRDYKDALAEREDIRQKLEEQRNLSRNGTGNEARKAKNRAGIYQTQFDRADTKVKQLRRNTALRQFAESEMAYVSGRQDALNQTNAAQGRYTDRFEQRLEQGYQINRIVQDKYDTMVESYGAIPQGENASRTVSVPQRTEKGNRVSQTVRTAMEAQATTDEGVRALKKAVVDGNFSYLPITDKAAGSKALQTIKDKGYQKALADWTVSMSKGHPGKNDVALGFQLYNQAVNSGDTKTAVQVLSDLASRVREGAQMVQAVRMLKKLSPDNQLYSVQLSLKALQDDVDGRYGKKAPKLKLNEALVNNFLEAENEAQKEAAQKAIYRDIASQLPHTFMDRWNSWRYLCMLGNVRTHVRNILGNAGFVPVRRMKDALALGIETAYSKAKGGNVERSKGFVSPNSDLYKLAKADYENIADLITGGGKYTDAASGIESMKSAFGEKGVWKYLSKIADANSFALDAEDVWFSKPAYAQSLAGYLKANKITAEQFNADEAIRDKARAYAVKEAQRATYRDYNDFSNFIAKVGRTKRGGGATAKVASTLMEGVLPFRRTPANILVRGVEYSPIGLAQGIYQATRGVKTGKYTAAQAIDRISSGLTGTALVALGALLTAHGILTPPDDDDEKQAGFDKLRGAQSYALKIGKTYVTVDWLAPEALPVFVGSQLSKLFSGDSEGGLKALYSALTTISEPMLEMSMLSSLQDVIENVSYADSKLMAILSTAATNYLTQAFPTLAGQIERIAESERETTFATEDSPLTKDLQYILAKIMNKTPGEFQQIPYIDAWGRHEDTGTVLARAFNNLLNPAYLSYDKSEPFEDELQRLYDLGYSDMLPQRVKQSQKVEGETLTQEEYVAFAETKGKTQYEALKGIIESSWYEELSDAVRGELLGMAYSYADGMAKLEVNENADVSTWILETKAAVEDGGKLSEILRNRLDEDVIDFQTAYPQYADLGDNKIHGYLEYCEPAGVPLDTVYNAAQTCKDFEGEKDSDGKTISGSVKAQVVEYIQSLGLNRTQAKALWDALKGNWKDEDTPWA